MRYSIARAKIKTGDILAFSHTGWKSLNDIKIGIVRMFTQSEYSHVGIAWVTSGRVFVLEAVVPEIRIFPLSKYEQFYHLHMPKPLFPVALEFALSLIGEEYSQIEAMKAFFGKSCTENKKWECAEYVQEVMRMNGMPLPGEATPTNVVLKAMSMYNVTIQSVEGDK
jgi:hypothetical protein